MHHRRGIEPKWNAFICSTVRQRGTVAFARATSAAVLAKNLELCAVVSLEPVTTCSILGAIATLEIVSAYSLMLPTNSPDAVSHTRSWPSLEPDTIRAPSSL